MKKNFINSTFYEPTVTKTLYDWWTLNTNFHFTYLLTYLIFTYLLSCGSNMWNPAMWSETVGLRIRPV